jgi:hypothetical protein
MRHLVAVLDANSVLVLDSESGQVRRQSTRHGGLTAPTRGRITGSRGRRYQVFVIDELLLGRLPPFEDGAWRVVIYFERVIAFAPSKATAQIKGLLQRLIGNERRSKMLEILQGRTLDAAEIYTSFLRAQVALFSSTADPFSHLLDQLSNLLESGPSSVASSSLWTGAQMSLHMGEPFPTKLDGEGP